MKSKGSLDGVTSPQNAFIFGEIQELNASPKGIQSLINDLSSVRKDVNPILAHLGTVSFHGEISGFITQLITFGEFDSNIGKLQADMMISRNAKRKSGIKGTAETSGLQIREFFCPKEIPLGEISFKFDLDGHHPHK